jgi:hypothetical protein
LHATEPILLSKLASFVCVNKRISLLLLVLTSFKIPLLMTPAVEASVLVNSILFFKLIYINYNNIFKILKLLIMVVLQPDKPHDLNWLKYLSSHVFPGKHERVRAL